MRYLVDPENFQELTKYQVPRGGASRYVGDRVNSDFVSEGSRNRIALGRSLVFAQRMPKRDQVSIRGQHQQFALAIGLVYGPVDIALG